MAEEIIQKTYREIGVFDSSARQYLAREEAKWRSANPENKSAQPVSKFTYAIQRMLKRSQSVLENWGEIVQDLNIKHASEDKDGNLDSDGRGQFKFKRDELLKRNKEQRDLFGSQTEIEPYYATSVPEDLDPEDREIFIDFIIKDEGGGEPE